MAKNMPRAIFCNLGAFGSHFGGPKMDSSLAFVTGDLCDLLSNLGSL